MMSIAKLIRTCGLLMVAFGSVASIEGEVRAEAPVNAPAGVHSAFRLKKGLTHTSVIKLSDGRTITGRQALELVTAMQREALENGHDLRVAANRPIPAVIKVDPRVVLLEQTQRLDHLEKVKVAEQHSRSGWSALIGRPYSRPLFVLKFATKGEDQKGTKGEDQKGVKKESNPSLPKAGKPGKLKHEPLHADWEHTYGEKKFAAVYGKAVADFDAGAVSQRGGTIAASITLEGGAYVLHNKIELIKLVAQAHSNHTGAAKDGTTAASIDFYLLGKKTWDAKSSKDGKIAKFAKEWKYETSKYNKDIPVYAGFFINLQAHGVGKFSVTANLDAHLDANAATLTGSVEPKLSGHLVASAAGSAAGVLKAGVEGDLNLLTLSVPTRVELGLKIKETQALSLWQTMKSEVDLQAMSGTISAFVEIDSKVLESVDSACDTGASVVNTVAGWFNKHPHLSCDIPKKIRKSKELWSFKGIQTKHQLIDLKNITNVITF